ncbi:RluA family pseudouridine synthase [Ruminococcaceae bacterium OttesenSCG-928-O06]|nr:RluA family pseudouridine synthase [Ruminococcaceae bacterium OttesenSCG-928-O06]
MQRIECQVLPEEATMRLDRFVAEKCGVPRALAQKLIEEENVLVNGKKPTKGLKLAEGDALEITLPPPKQVEILPQNIPLDIVYEDDWLLVVDKPKGMVVHPAAGNWDGTMVNALMHHCGDSLSGIGGEVRPGIVHRIDKDTSGLLVVAKNDEAHQKLAAQLAQHSMQRQYQAVVYGHFRQREGIIDAPIGRSKKDRKKMAVTQSNAKSAVTAYEVVAEYPGFTHLRLRLQTGRTHQIRVHMAEVGHPLAGDAVYGPKKVIRSLGGQCLHAAMLGFIHPKTGQEMCFTSPLPVYFISFLQSLGQGQEEPEDGGDA